MDKIIMSKNYFKKNKIIHMLNKIFYFEFI